MKTILILLFVTSCASMGSFKSSEYYQEYLSYMKKEAQGLIYPGSYDDFRIYKGTVSKEEVELTPMMFAGYIDANESEDNDEEIRLHNEAIFARIEARYNELYSENASENRRKGVRIIASVMAAMGGRAGGSESTSSSYRAPSSCSSDYECGPNQACGSKNTLGLGTCMNVVNRYKQTDYNYQKSFGVKKVEDCPAIGCGN